jgi:hypothetical protein
VADAISFGTKASTLVLEPTSSITGTVQANAADTLDLAGTSSGTLSGYEQFNGFKTIDVESGSDWALSGVMAGTVMNVDGLFSVTGLFGGGSVTLGAGGWVQTVGSGDFQAENLSLAGGTLQCGSQGVVVIGNTVLGASDGAIIIDAGTKVTGYGSIRSTSAINGSGTIDATKNTLSVNSSVGSLSLIASAGSTLALSGGGSLGTSVSGAGTLQLNGTTPYLLKTASKISIAAVAVEAKTTLSGTGTIASKLANAGTVTATSGTLTLGAAVTGSGVFSAGSGALLDFADGVTTAGQIAGAGIVEFGAASTLDAGIKLSAARVVQAANLTLGSATSLAVAAGESFSLHTGSGGTITLSGAAGDKFSNSGSIANSGVGTADISVAFVNAKSVLAGSGAISFLASVSNTGTMGDGSGKMSFASEVTGTGTLAVGSGTLTLSDGASSGQSVQFQGLTGLLDLAHPLTFAGLISDFAGSDKIDLLDVAANGFKFTGGVLTIEDGKSTVAALPFVGSYTQSDFAIGSDDHSGTFITFK